MRTSSGFDRIATEEELHQVLAVLEKTPDGWVLTENFDDSDDSITPCDDSLDAEALAEFATQASQLKN